MSSSDEARRRLRTLSREQLRGKLPLGKLMPGSSRSVSRERCLVEDWAAGEGGSRSCSIRASVSDCMQLSLDGIRNSLRGTSSLFGCDRQKAGAYVSSVQMTISQKKVICQQYSWKFCCVLHIKSAKLITHKVNLEEKRIFNSCQRAPQCTLAGLGLIQFRCQVWILSQEVIHQKHKRSLNRSERRLWEEKDELNLGWFFFLHILPFLCLLGREISLRNLSKSCCYLKETNRKLHSAFSMFGISKAQKLKGLVSLDNLSAGCFLFCALRACVKNSEVSAVKWLGEQSSKNSIAKAAHRIWIDFVFLHCLCVC